MKQVTDSVESGGFDKNRHVPRTIEKFSLYLIAFR